MNFRNNKKIAIVMAIVVLSLALATTSFAADNYKNLKAWFGEIKIFHNNAEVQLKDKPFIVDGTTYLPVRSVSEMLGMEVTWDQAKKHVGINDKPGTSFSEMQNKFIVQEVKIIELEAKVKDLEEQLKTKVEEEKVTTLSDLEKQLNKDHGTSNRVDFDIRLYGTTKDIEVRIYADDNRYYYGWDSLTSTQKERYLQGIVDDILREFKNAKVSGYVEESTTYGKLTSFTVSSRGVVSLDNRYSDTYGDLERYLNDTYTNRSSYGIRNIMVSESNDVFLTIEVDRYYWNATYPSVNQEAILKEIGDYIVNRYDYNYNYSYYDYNDVSGVIKEYSGSTMYNFDFDYYGTLKISY